MTTVQMKASDLTVERLKRHKILAQCPHPQRHLEQLPFIRDRLPKPAVEIAPWGPTFDRGQIPIRLHGDISPKALERALTPTLDSSRHRGTYLRLVRLRHHCTRQLISPHETILYEPMSSGITPQSLSWAARTHSAIPDQPRQQHCSAPELRSTAPISAA